MIRKATAEGAFIDLVRAVLNGEKPSPLPGGVSADAVYQIGLRQDMAPLVYCALYTLEPRPESESWSLWQRRFLSDCQRSEIQTEEARRLIRFLCSHGVKVLPLKGFVIKQLYPAPHLRTMCDVDLMYEGVGTEELAVLMEEAGYTAESLDSWCHDTFHKKPCMNAELHRKLLADFNPCGAVLQNMFGRAEQDEHVPGLYRMRPEDLYIHVIAHAAKHFQNTGIGVRPLADIYVLERTYGAAWDFAYIRRQLQTAGLDVFETKLRETARAFFGPEEREVPERDLLFFFRGGTYGDGGDAGWQYAGGSRAGFLLEKTFLPYATMREIYPVLAKWPVLLPFAWIYRICDVLLHRRENLRRVASAGVNAEKARKRAQIMADFGLDRLHG